MADFSDNKVGYFTHLSGQIEVLNPPNETTSFIPFRPGQIGADGKPGLMEFGWRFADQSEAPFASMRFGLRGPFELPAVTLDLTEWQTLEFKVKGEAKLIDNPQAAPVTSFVLRLEVYQADMAPQSMVHRYLQVTPGEKWTRVVMPASLNEPESGWISGSIPFKEEQAKELRFVIDRRFCSRNGSIQLDDFALQRIATVSDLGEQSDDEFLEEMARDAFALFWDYGHPEYGWAPVSTQQHSMYAPEGIGFQLTIIPIAIERGWITRSQGAERVRKIFKPCLELPQGDEPEGVIGYKGQFYHFLGKDGLRLKPNGISNVCHAIFILGAMTCEGYFDRPGEGDIRQNAQTLFDRCDWRLTLFPEEKHAGIFSMEWRSDFTYPDNLFPYGWDYYTDEPQILCFVALAANQNRPKKEQIREDIMWKWGRVFAENSRGKIFVPGPRGTMFAHTWTSHWLPPQILNREDKHPTAPENWWQGAQAYCESAYDFCQTMPDIYKGGVFGYNACETRYKGQTLYYAYGVAPVVGTNAPNATGKFFIRHGQPKIPFVKGPEYNADGTRNPPQAYVPQNHVITPYGMGSAMPFLPKEATRGLRHLRENTDIYRTADCGFGDAIDLETGWINRANFVIDACSLIIPIDNFQAMKAGKLSVVWEAILKSPEMQYAFEKVYGR